MIVKTIISVMRRDRSSGNDVSYVATVHTSAPDGEGDEKVFSGTSAKSTPAPAALADHMAAAVTAARAVHQEAAVMSDNMA